MSAKKSEGTESAGTGIYNKHTRGGVYECAGCKAPLYKSTTKFDSNCVWPAFFDAIPGAVKRYEGTIYEMIRTEIVCNNCEGHLGHVFQEKRYNIPANERHCINSISLSFKK